MNLHLIYWYNLSLRKNENMLKKKQNWESNNKTKQDAMERTLRRRGCRTD